MYFILYWVVLTILGWVFEPSTTETYIFSMTFSLAFTFIWWMSSVADKLHNILKELKKINDKENKL